MSVFSEMLSGFITEKDIVMRDLIDYCGVERSTLYQIIKGKRYPPSNAVLKKIADFMQLSMSEWEELLKAAEVCRVGEKVFFRRQSVESFICNFPADLSEIWHRDMKTSGEIDITFPSDPCRSLSTNLEVNNILQKLIFHETRKKRGHIALLLQPDDTFLFQMLSSLTLDSPVLLEHVICMSSIDEVDREKKLLHIKYLENIFPLFVRNNIDYHPYYYYDKVEAHFNNMNGYPYWILTQDYAVMCSVDYRQGVLFKDPQVVGNMWKLYREYQGKCSELFRFLDLDLEDMTQVNRMVAMVDYSIPYYIMERELGIEPLLSRDILDHCIDPAIPERKTYVDQLDGKISELREAVESGRFKMYFSMTGLDNFVRDGIVTGLPEGILIPANKEDKISILRNLQAYCHEGHYRMLGRRLETISPHLHIGINGGIVYLTFNGPEQHMKYLLLTEPQIFTMFKDYVENLGEDSFYTIEETEQYIESLIYFMGEDGQ